MKKKDKALKILKEFLNSPNTEPPLGFYDAIALAIKEMEGKPYMFEGAEKRMMLSLKRAHTDDAGEFIVDVFLDDQLLHNIWCDHLSVFAGKPPIYCLNVGGTEVIALTARLMVVYPEMQDVINAQTRAALGEYVTLGKIKYENNQLQVVPIPEEKQGDASWKDIKPLGPLWKNNRQLIEVKLTRKEFLSLPMETTRRIVEEEAWELTEGKSK